MNDWDSGSNILEDLQSAKRAIEQDTGIGRPISLREALYWECQSLYLAGYTAEQVSFYVKFVLSNINGHGKEAHD